MARFIPNNRLSCKGNFSKVESLEIPPFSKGCVKTSKVMMDLMKVRYGNCYCDDDSGSVVIMMIIMVMYLIS